MKNKFYNLFKLIAEIFIQQFTKIIYFVPVILVMISVQSFAQNQINVTGIVTNDSGRAIANVSVQESGTNQGTVTRDDGSFSLNVSNPDATLLFSYVGFTNQEVKLNNRSTINVQLHGSATNLNEVVVIGYQSVRRKDLTGATGIVNMTDANKVTAASVGESIQGLVPGVTVRNTGAPGGNATIDIRGVGSFTDANPLYVIDGMLADANTTINTDDVASIQILKDASAAAIYGSRAGNGVIIITTKKGREGPAKISTSAKYGIQQIPKQWNVMDASQYLQTVKQQYANSGIDLPAGVADQLANNTINTNWQDAVYRTGNDEDYNIGISGGARTSNYLISGSYYKNQGVLIGNSFERASLRVNTESKRGPLTIGENMVLSSTYGENPGGGVNVFYESPQMLPIIAVQGDQYKSIQYNPAGWGMGTTDIPTYASNYLAVNALDQQTYHFFKIVGNAYADLKLTSWLSYRFNLGAEVSFDYSKEVRDTGIWRYTNQPPQTGVGEERAQFTNFLMEHTLNFNKIIGKHAINGVVGFSRTQQRRDYTDAGRTLLQSVNGQLFTTIGSALGTPTANGGTDIFWRNHGYLGRINYTYNDKYLLTLTGRVDQDSRFSPNFRTGFFPSGAIAWRLSKESFFNVSWISDLKLRASYGKLGISSVLPSWGYFANLNNYPRAVYGVDQTPVVGQYQANIINPDIHWETRIQKNIGLDASLFNNRVSLTADVYNSRSEDVLVDLPLPVYLGGASAPFVNAATIKNTGVELSATYRNNTHLLKWDVSANITTIKNRVVSVGNQGIDASGNHVDYLEPTNFIRAEVGHSIGEWYVIPVAGIFQSQDEIDNYKNKDGILIQPNAKPGDIKYVDVNGDGTINNSDRQYEGSPWPTLQTGAQFNASYKQFSINIQLVGIFGSKIYDDIRRVLDSYQLTNFRKDINPWSSTNTGGTDPRLAVDVPNDPEISINNMAQTSRWLENGSYVRLRNVEIGYTFPKSILGNINFTNARLYISGQNLFTITKYKGLDPDVQGNGILERGFDAGNWPSSRVFSVGFQCEF
ncbi:MAG: SusC/RagA family TonB-linked outer membrane protein [Chitinophagaceae bacterium]